jgi:acyl-coenzyme A thioesterase PaaI-like protein
VTISLAVNYVGMLQSGKIRAIGYLKGAGRKVFFAYGEVLDEDGKIVASGQTAHKCL